MTEQQRHLPSAFMASLVAQRLKRLPPMQETWVPSLEWEDPLEMGPATHSSILAWRIPWAEERGCQLQGFPCVSDGKESTC